MSAPQHGYMQQYGGYQNVAQQQPQQQMYGQPMGGVNPAQLMGAGGVPGMNPMQAQQTQMQPQQQQYNGMGLSSPQKYSMPMGYGQPQQPQQQPQQPFPMMGGGVNLTNGMGGMSNEMLQNLRQTDPQRYAAIVQKFNFQQQQQQQLQRSQSQPGYPGTPQQQPSQPQSPYDARTGMMQPQHTGSPAPPPRPSTAMSQASNSSYSGQPQNSYGSAMGYGGQKPMQSYMGAGVAGPLPGTPVQQSQMQQQPYGTSPIQTTPPPQIQRPPTASGRPMSPAVGTPASAGPEQSPMLRGAKRKASELGDAFAGTPPPEIKNETAYGGSMGPPAAPTPPASGPSASPTLQRRPTLSGPSTTPARASTSLVPAAPAFVLPPNVSQELTKVTSVRLAGSDTTIPPLEAEQISEVQGWLARDHAYLGELRSMRERMRNEIATVVRKPAEWFEQSDVPNAADALKARNQQRNYPFTLTYPASKWAEHGAGRKSRKEVRIKNRLLPLPRTLSVAQAERLECLVPIRIEFDVPGQGQKFREAFVWNMNDPLVDCTVFAKSICDDFLLDPEKHASTLSKMIEEQLSDFKAHDITPPEASGSDIIRGRLDEKEAKWWSEWRRSLRTSKGVAFGTPVKPKVKPKKVKSKAVVSAKSEDDGDADVEMDMDERDDVKPLVKRRSMVVIDVDDVDAKKKAPGEQEEDLRIIVHIDIIVGSMNLKDQFEWDVVNQDNSPEEFAAVYCSELGIGGEFKTAIAHAIREQTQVHLKSLFIVGHPMDGSVIQEEEVRQAFLPSISVAARSFDQTSTFSPTIEYLSDGEIDRAEKEREKELKRKRRQTKGKRAVALPDREPQKTHRTAAIGLPEVDPATLSVGSIMPTSSRRAAAAAASASIASMVAIENRSEHDEYGGSSMSMPIPAAAPQPVQPQAAPAPPPKVSKIRGSFKPPAIARPEAVANPRASMNKTESTAYVSEQQAANGRGAANTSSFHKPKPESKTTEETGAGDVVLRNPMINGVWHCTTCGIPDDIAVGRRKGPNGLKSQCGTCGKWWHQHRKLRQVEWNPDREYHLRLMREASTKNKRSRPPATPSRREKVEEKPPAPASPSSMSSMSNQSEDLPLSKRSRTLSKSNGTSNSHVVKAEPYTVEKIKAEPFVLDTPTTSRAADTAASGNGQDASNSSASKPDWLVQAENEMHDRYPHDVFHVIARVRGQPVEPNVPVADDEVWRLKCSDCPGKLYKPGPDETLNNFEVHLRNRLHRQKVADRVGLPVNGSFTAPSDA